jgi:imidazolonepropionase-like amidohydrolase
MITSAYLKNGACPCCLAYMQVPKRASWFSRLTDVVVPKAGAPVQARAHVHMPSAGTVCLDGGSIVDPRDGSVMEGVSILMNGGRIVAIEKSGAVKADPSVQRIDAKGKFIVPGFNDMHSHVLELENPSGSLALMLADGVTGFRQMSGSEEMLKKRRDHTLPIGKEAPAALEIPGAVLTPLVANSVAAAIAEIGQQKKDGADFIKVAFIKPDVFIAAMREAKRLGIAILGHLQDGVDAVASSRSGFRSIEHLGPGATIWLSCSTAEKALSDEVKPVSIPAAPLKIPLLRKIIWWRFQTVLINPSAFSPPDYVARMQKTFDTFDEQKCRSLAAVFVEEGTWHCPTFVRLRSMEWADLPEYESNPGLKYLPKKNVKKWRAVTKKFKNLPKAMHDTYREAYPLQLKLAKLLADCGVRMLAGSDGGSYLAPGVTLQEEFIELGNAGFSPLKILQMTTTDAADYLGRAETMGTVESGKNADVVLLDANPLESVSNFCRIAGVVRAGHYYSKQDLEALKARVAKSRGYLN